MESLSILAYQLDSLIKRNIVVFNRLFFTELFYKRWLNLGFTLALVLLLFI
jgi:hypothetical protein